MLPTTKRPGRGDESADEDDVTELGKAVDPSNPQAGRAKFASLSDEEMTNVIPAKAVGAALEAARASSPRPAAGMPHASASSATRPGKFATGDDDGERRTVVRGGPKIAKRSALRPNGKKGKASSAKGGEHLMAPPPQDLIEDLSDRHLIAAGPASEKTEILHTTGSGPAVTMQGGPVQTHGSVRPGAATASGGYAAQRGGPVYAAPSASGPAAPAHFMVPQAPHSEGRGPLSSASAASLSGAGRPVMSWAMVLMALGLFVGAGAFAAKRGRAAGVMQTSAAFVDPARAGAIAVPPAMVGAAANAALAAQAVAPVANDPPPAAASLGAPATSAAPIASVVVGTAAAPRVAPAPVVAAPPAVVATATAPRHAHPTPHPAGRVEEPVAAAPAAKPAAPPAKPRGTKGTGDPALDEEQRKALKALQESQLESTF